jgi:hypothetical protein
LRGGMRGDSQTGHFFPPANTVSAAPTLASAIASALV